MRAFIRFDRIIVAFSDCGTFLATAGGDQQMFVVNVASGDVVFSLDTKDISSTDTTIKLL